MPEQRYLVSDFMKQWERGDFPPHVWHYTSLDGDDVILPEIIPAAPVKPVAPTPIESVPGLPIGYSRDVPIPSAPTLRPLFMELPQEDESYPYFTIDDLTSYYHRWSHPDEAHAWLRRLYSSEYVVIDTETTGSRRYSQVIEIAVLSKQGDLIFHSLLQPSTPIEPIATSVHGLTWKDVKDAPTFDTLSGDLYQCLQNKLVLAYNAAFDIRLLFQTARAFRMPFPPPEAACLMYCYSKVRGEKTPRGQYRRFPLGEACLHMEVTVPTVQFGGDQVAMLEHRARDDARHLYELLQCLMKQAGRRQ